MKRARALAEWGIFSYAERHAAGPVAQLDRALPSEGRGQRFESSRVRHLAPGPNRSLLFRWLPGVNLSIIVFGGDAHHSVVSAVRLIVAQ